MIPVLEAQQIIDRHVGPLSDEEVPPERLQGRVLREPVAAMEDMPPFDRSAVDGYALRIDDEAVEFEVIGEIRAGGAIDRSLRHGQAVRIFTGARLPEPELRVVMQEHVRVEGDRIYLLKPGGGSNVRLRGEDARAGEILLEPGTVLGATALGLLASLGKVSARVSRKPTIFHLTTGDEIVPPGQTPDPGQIRNSNAPLIAALCREQGIESLCHRHAGDDLREMTRIMSEARAESFDVVLISGGSGLGAYDFSAELFRHLGAAIHFREVNVRPGKPLMFGTSATQVVFGLPGNVLAHFACFHLFVRRALDRLTVQSPPGTTQGVLAVAMPDTANARETWWPARCEMKAGRLEARALPWKSSGDMTRLAQANALIKVPASTAYLPEGTSVELLMTGSVF